jgi:hypothetical protein
LLEANIWAIETIPISVTINLVMIEKKFSQHKVRGPNFFNRQTLWQPKFSITNVAAIKNVLIAPLYGDQNIPIVT